MLCIFSQSIISEYSVHLLWCLCLDHVHGMGCLLNSAIQTSVNEHMSLCPLDGLKHMGLCEVDCVLTCGVIAVAAPAGCFTLRSL